MSKCCCAKCNSGLSLADRVVVKPVEDNCDYDLVVQEQSCCKQSPGPGKIGNPVFTCTNEAANYNVHMNVQENPGTKKQHPLFKTTSSDYGRVQPTPEILPPYFLTVTQSFSQAQSAGGMWRNQGFNTAVDRSRVLRD